MGTLIEKQGQSVKMQLKDIALFVTWGKIASEYFGKSSSWLYNKLNETDGNGGHGEFTEEEIIKFKEALID